MGNYSVLVVFFLCFLRAFTVHGGCSLRCRVGWVQHYRDCFKAFDVSRDYNGAKSFCDSLEASLVHVRDIETERVLVRITEGAYEKVWLGGQYDGHRTRQSGQFKWDDGRPFEYANWGVGFPAKGLEAESCVILRPVTSTTMGQLQGQWEDFSCDLESYVVCQTPAFYATRWPDRPDN